MPFPTIYYVMRENASLSHLIVEAHASLSAPRVSVPPHDRSYGVTCIFRGEALSRSCTAKRYHLIRSATGSAREVRSSSRESALIKGFRKVCNGRAHAYTHAHTDALGHVCSVVSHLSARYPGMIAACVIYVRATCTRNLRA